MLPLLLSTRQPVNRRRLLLRHNALDHVPGVLNEAMFSLGPGPIDANTVVLVTIAEGAVTNNDPADVIAAGTGDDTLGGNAKATLRFDVVAVDG